MVVGILQVKGKVSMPNAVMFGKGHLVTKDIRYSGFSVFIPFLSPRKTPRSRKFIRKAFTGASSSRGWVYEHGSRQTRRWSMSNPCTGGRERTNSEGHRLLKPQVHSRVTLLLQKPHFLILPKQLHQPEITHPCVCVHACLELERWLKLLKAKVYNHIWVDGVHFCTNHHNWWS